MREECGGAWDVGQPARGMLRLTEQCAVAEVLSGMGVFAGILGTFTGVSVIACRGRRSSAHISCAWAMECRVAQSKRSVARAQSHNTSSYSSPSPVAKSACAGIGPLEAWCCLHFKNGCPTLYPPPTQPPLPFDCAAGYENWMAGWSVEKKAPCRGVASSGLCT